MNKKHALFLLLASSALSFSMESGHPYSKEFKTIEKTNANKLIKHTCTENPLREIYTIQKKLDNIQNKLLSKQEDAVLRIKNRYGISDEVWQIRRQSGLVLIHHRENNKHISMPNVTRDKNIPAHLISMLKRNLEENGINPEQYNFVIDKKHAIASSPAISYSLETLKDGRRLHTKTSTPGDIQLASQMIANLSLKGQEGLCFFLAQSINLCNNIIPDFAIMSTFKDLNMFYHKEFQINLTDADIEFNQWLTIIVLTLKHAAQNKYTAEILKTFHQEIGYTIPVEELGIEHYRLLSKINRYHQALDWLKKYVLQKTEGPTTLETRTA